MNDRPPPPRIRRRKRVSQKPTEDVILRGIWLHIRKHYFPERQDLDSYAIQWSRRKQRRVLASCCITKRKVIVARELNRAEHARWLQPLIYHEMCHAYLGEGVEHSYNKRLWHGPEFRSLEKRHPEIEDLDQWIKSGGWYRAVLSDRARRRTQRK